MNTVVKALEKREKMTILYRRKIKGIILPAGEVKSCKVEKHPFFGMAEKEDTSVAKQMQELRGSRFNAV